MSYKGLSLTLIVALLIISVVGIAGYYVTIIAPPEASFEFTARNISQPVASVSPNRTCTESVSFSFSVRNEGQAGGIVNVAFEVDNKSMWTDWSWNNVGITSSDSGSVVIPNCLQHTFSLNITSQTTSGPLGSGGCPPPCNAITNRLALKT